MPIKKPAAAPRLRQRLPCAERRVDILEAARRVFIRSGYGATTIREVAAEGQVAHSLMYRYFESKDVLFEEAVAAPLEAAILHTFEPVTNEAGMAVVTQRFIAGLLVAMEEIGPLWNVVFGDAARAEHFYRHHLEPGLFRIQANAEKNLPTWDHSAFDVNVVTKMIYGICWLFAADLRYGASPRRSPAEIADQVTYILLNGMLARPPKAAKFAVSRQKRPSGA